jgi:3-phenylpropionate/cinnamic acid dioxygenase small subunit
MDVAVQRLIDRQEIADLLVRYTFGLDARDWDLVRSCFTDAPVFVHPGGRVDGAEGIVDRARGALQQLDASQHLLGNVVVELGSDGATARSVCYFQAQHVRAGTPGGDTYVIAGSYTDTLVRTAEGWKIAERVQAYLWRDGNRDVVAR